MFLAENRAANQGTVRIAKRHSDDVRGAARSGARCFLLAVAKKSRWTFPAAGQ
jgi:hypothetical protein